MRQPTEISGIVEVMQGAVFALTMGGKPRFSPNPKINL